MTMRVNRYNQVCFLSLFLSLSLSISFIFLYVGGILIIYFQITSIPDLLEQTYEELASGLYTFNASVVETSCRRCITALPDPFWTRYTPSVPSPDHYSCQISDTFHTTLSNINYYEQLMSIRTVLNVCRSLSEVVINVSLVQSWDSLANDLLQFFQNEKRENMRQIYICIDSCHWQIQQFVDWQHWGTLLNGTDQLVPVVYISHVLISRACGAADKDIAYSLFDPQVVEVIIRGCRFLPTSINNRYEYIERSCKPIYVSSKTLFKKLVYKHYTSNGLLKIINLDECIRNDLSNNLNISLPHWPGRNFYTIGLESGTLYQTPPCEMIICPQGSLLISKFIKNKILDEQLLKRAVQSLVGHLNVLLDNFFINYNGNFVLRNTYIRQKRPISISVFGIQEALQLLCIPYDSVAAASFVDSLFKILRSYAYQSSAIIGKDRNYSCCVPHHVLSDTALLEKFFDRSTVMALKSERWSNISILTTGTTKFELLPPSGGSDSCGIQLRLLGAAYPGIEPMYLCRQSRLLFQTLETKSLLTEKVLKDIFDYNRISVPRADSSSFTTVEFLSRVFATSQRWIGTNHIPSILLLKRSQYLYDGVLTVTPVILGSDGFSSFENFISHLFLHYGLAVLNRVLFLQL